MNESGAEPELSFPKGMSAYLRTRLQLVSIETQEALTHLKSKLVPIIVLLVCAVASYALLLTALVSFLGKLLRRLGENALLDWEVAALIIAGLHLALIFVMKNKIITKSSGQLFEYSRSELERDREWMQENNPTSKNSSAN